MSRDLTMMIMRYRVCMCSPIKSLSVRSIVCRVCMCSNMSPIKSLSVRSIVCMSRDLTLTIMRFRVCMCSNTGPIKSLSLCDRSFVCVLAASQFWRAQSAAQFGRCCHGAHAIEPAARERAHANGRHGAQPHRNGAIQRVAAKRFDGLAPIYDAPVATVGAARLHFNRQLIRAAIRVSQRDLPRLLFWRVLLVVDEILKVNVDTRQMHRHDQFHCDKESDCE